MQECPYCHEKTLNPLRKFALRKSMFNTCSNCTKRSTYIPNSPFKHGFTFFVGFILLMPIGEYLNPSGNRFFYWIYLFAVSFLIASINTIPRPYITLEQAEKTKAS